MGRKRIPKHAGRYRLGQTGTMRCLMDRLLNHGFVQVVPMHDPPAPVGTLEHASISHARRPPASGRPVSRSGREDCGTRTWSSIPISPFPDKSTARGSGHVGVPRGSRSEQALPGSLDGRKSRTGRLLPTNALVASDQDVIHLRHTSNAAKFGCVPIQACTKLSRPAFTRNPKESNSNPINHLSP